MAKSKKMTCKEFKEILNKAGYDFDIWGFEGILNIVSIHDSDVAKEWESQGKENMAKCHKEKSDIIYKEVEKRGYYNTK